MSVRVPSADEMDAETFLRHLDLRHRADTGETSDLIDHPDRSPGWVEPYRALHRRAHDTEDHPDHWHREATEQ